MSAEVPIIQSIHKSKTTADWKPWYSEEHGASISSIGITSNKQGYRLTTYAGGWGYDGYVIDAKAEGGLFKANKPTRIETGRDHKNIFPLIFGEAEVTDEGLVEVKAAISKPARREHLLLPGDEGFELFEELHAQGQKIQPIITDAINLVQDGINPDYINYEYKGDQGAYFDHDKQIASVKGSALVEIEDDSGQKVKVELDATQNYPFETSGSLPTFKSNDEVVYRSGIATVEKDGEEEIRALDLYTLVAFSDIQTTLDKLYKSKI